MKEQSTKRKHPSVEFLSIRLTPQKYAEIKLAAAKAGLSASGFSRQAIFERLALREQHQQQSA